MSFRSRAAKDQEFIAAAKEHPVFSIDYLDANREYRQLTSAQASEVKVTCEADGAGKTLMATFRGIADLGMYVTIYVQARPTEKFSRGRLRSPTTQELRWWMCGSPLSCAPTN